MDNSPDTTIFARLSDDKTSVLEYPVFALHIRNRSHPFDWYAKVIFNPRPEVPEFHSVREILTVRDEQVYANYKVSPDSLDQVLSMMYQLGKGLVLPGQEPEPLVFEKVPAATIERVKTLSKALAQSKMDVFASLKEYDSMASACSYSGSSIAAFKADADKCNQIRDNTWTALYMYFNDVEQGTKPLPKSSADIEALLPEMVWE